MIKLYLFYLKSKMKDLDTPIELYGWTDSKKVKKQFLKIRDDLFYVKKVELERNDYKYFLKYHVNQEIVPIKIDKNLSILGIKSMEYDLGIEAEYLSNEMEGIHELLYDTRLKKKYKDSLNYLCQIGQSAAINPNINYFKLFLSLFKNQIFEGKENEPR